jgi:cell division septal protein FtsQ
MRKRKFRFPLAIIALCLVILIVFLAVLSYICHALSTAQYFTIREVFVSDRDRADFSYLKGKNIFAIDLKDEARYILEAFPDCASVRIVRVLPDRLFLYFVKRKAVALVKLYKYFSVDDEAVFFQPKNMPEEDGLPVITGLETKIFGPKPGKKYCVRELLLSLKIIKAIKRIRLLKDYKLKRIDAASSSSCTVFLLLPAQDKLLLEIRLGEERVGEKISMLAGLIAQERSNIANIKYIDLRFKEPVIKLNDAKPKT